MKKTFKTFLEENAPSFYTLYTTKLPSDEVKEMPDGEKKNEETKVETIKYGKLMTSFLQYVGAMND